MPGLRFPAWRRRHPVSPAFRHARVELQGGAVLTVNAANNSRENVYVQSLKINGTPWTKTWVPHELIARGATLDFVMGPQPSRWGSGVDDVPRSLTARGQRPQLLFARLRAVQRLD